MLITGRKNYVGYLDEILHKRRVENWHSNEKIAENNILVFVNSLLSGSFLSNSLLFQHRRAEREENLILVFLFKRLKARWTDAFSLFFLIGIGFTCKKIFRKTFQRLLGRKPRRFCDQLTFSIIQVFAYFLDFLKICPKMFPFFWLKRWTYVCWLRKTKHSRG